MDPCYVIKYCRHTCSFAHALYRINEQLILLECTPTVIDSIVYNLEHKGNY